MGLNLGELFVKIGAQLKGFDEAMGKVEKKLHTMGEKLQRAGTALSIGVTAPLAALAAGALKASIDFETAFASVRKNVDGTEADLQKLASGIEDLSTRIPATTKEIAAVASAAGQLGIESQNILSFTETMIALGETTNLSADEAAQALARLANITRLPQDQFDRLGSSLLALGKSSASTEKEIADMALRIAGAGAQVGLLESEILAIAAALSSVGIESESGGTAISRVLIEIAKAAEIGGKRLEDFASVAGMTGQEFADSFKDAPAETLTVFIEGLGRLESEGRSVIQVLQALEFENVRIRDALLRSSNAGDLLRKSLVTGRQAWEDNKELTETASKRYETTGAQLEILRNKFLLAAKNLGDALMPAFRAVIGAVGGFVGVIGDLASGFDSLSEPVKRLILAMAAVVAAIGPVLLAMGAATKAVAGFTVVLQFLSRHPLVLLATAVAGLVVSLGAYYSGINDARDATVDLGAVADATTKRIEELQKSLQKIGSESTKVEASLKQQEAFLRQIERNLASTKSSAEQAFLRDQIKATTIEIERLRKQLDGLRKDQEQAAGEEQILNAAQALLRAEAAAEKARLKFEELGNEQAYLAETIGIYERALDEVIGILPKGSDEIAILIGRIEELRDKQEKLAKAPKITPFDQHSADKTKELQSRLQGIGLAGKVLGDNFGAARAKIQETESAIADLMQEGFKQGKSESEILNTEGVKTAVAELENLRIKYQEIAFTHEEFAKSFKDQWAELGAQLQVTGAEIATVIFDVFTSLSQGIGNAVAQAIFYGQDLGDALMNVIKQIGAAFIASLIAMGIQELLFLILGLGVASKRTAAEIGSAAAITYAAAYAAATVGSIATGGLSLVAAAGIAAAQTAAMLVGAAASGAAGSAVGAGVVALKEGGITRGPTHALIGEAGTEVVSPLARLLAMMRDTVAGVVLGPEMSRALAPVQIPALAQNFRPQPLEITNHVTLVTERRAIARMVAEELPFVLQKKLGNAFG